jgi:hypothetical protein
LKELKYENKTISTNQTQNVREYNVTDLLRFIPYDLYDDLYELLDVKQIREPSDPIYIPDKISDFNTDESVSDLNGIIIPAYYEYKKRGHMTIEKELTKMKKDLNQYIRPIEEMTLIEFMDESTGQQKESTSKPENESFILGINDITKIALEWFSYKNGIVYKMNQIKDHNWITNDVLDSVYKRMDELLCDPLFEIPCKKQLSILKDNTIVRFFLKGYIDLIDINKDKICYELKIVKNLTKRHYLQVALYKILYDDCDSYRLFNIYDGSCYEISVSEKNVYSILKKLILRKL